MTTTAPSSKPIRSPPFISAQSAQYTGWSTARRWGARFRAAHPRPPRRGRPESVSLIFDRRIIRTTRVPGAPTSSPKASIRRSAVTTNPASSISKSTGHLALRRSSATPAISASAGGSPRRTRKPVGRLAVRATTVCTTRKQPKPASSGSDHLHRGDPAIHCGRPARTRPAPGRTTGDGGDGRHRRVHPPARRFRQPH